MQCGGGFKHLGDDVSEQLEIIGAAFKVLRHVRRKRACACCDRIVQGAAPSRPIERGIAGPGLLAQIIVAKFADHQPLYRQAEIYARQGVDLDRSTMARWVGACGALVRPLVDALQRYVLAPGKVHTDDTHDAGTGAGQRPDQDGADVGVCARRPPLRFGGGAGGVVRVHAESPGHPPANPSGRIPWRAAGGCLRRLRQGVCRWPRARGGMHGPCPPQDPRFTYGQGDGDDHRGAAQDSSVVRHRRTTAGPAAGPAQSDTTGTGAPTARRLRGVAAQPAADTVDPVGHDQGDQLHAQPVAGAGLLLRGRARRNRQQHRRKCVARTLPSGAKTSCSSAPTAAASGLPPCTR